MGRENILCEQKISDKYFLLGCCRCGIFGGFAFLSFSANWVATCGAFFRGEYYTYHTYTTKINGGTHMIKIGLLNTEHESECIWVKIIDYHHSEAFGQRFYITCAIYK